MITLLLGSAAVAPIGTLTRLDIGVASRSVGPSAETGRRDRDNVLDGYICWWMSVDILS